MWAEREPTSVGGCMCVTAKKGFYSLDTFEPPTSPFFGTSTHSDGRSNSDFLSSRLSGWVGIQRASFVSTKGHRLYLYLATPWGTL